MIAAVPFPLPPDRVLSTWSRELAAYQPRRLRLAHLLLHRVECLVRVARRRTVDPIQSALLRQLAAATPLELLRVDRDLLARWLHDLSADGLVESAGRLTERGRQALDASAYTAAAEERRVFTFLEEGDPEKPPTFLSLNGPAVALAPPGWRFDPATLESCVRQPEEWKTRHGFPTDVEAVLGPAGEADWRRVILDRPEQILLVFVSSGDALPRQLGFAVRPEGWALQAAAPVLILPAEDETKEILPDLTAEPSPDDWREAWRGWCRQRGLSTSDADACPVQILEDRVQVAAPRKMVERLVGDRNEAWLVSGTGRVRVAAPLEIVEGE